MSSSRDEWEQTKAAFKKVYKTFTRETGLDDNLEEEQDSTGTAKLSIQHHYLSRLKPDCIRLVLLQPGKGGDVITCSLQTYHFETLDEQYEALSYVWGSSDATKHIVVDNGSFAITATCMPRYPICDTPTVLVDSGLMPSASISHCKKSVMIKCHLCTRSIATQLVPSAS